MVEFQYGGEQMNKRVLITAGTALLCCVLAFTALYLYASRNNEALHTAVISVNGEEVRRIDLLTAPDEEFRVTNGEEYNIVCIRSGTVYVKEASCPDKICVRHGELRSEFLPIICLPNKLSIELK